ncbi:MAG: nucleotidyl transferase AbiEii/AbiGii toxin family protein [Prevotella sp.]|nr:nucleotidyl transferase AbiEii/AbiGii toxin family protein [Prevotella sp.]
MIHPDSRTLTWIEQVAKENKIRDIALVEKTIRAFSLLEALVRSGCPFLFKGGSSLMLHLNTEKRLSIDIDIICPPGTRIDDYIEKYSAEYGFSEVKLINRISRTDVPKQHAKFFYTVAYTKEGRQDNILLDVLFEDVHYTDIVELPIQSRLLKIDGEPYFVKLPSKEDLLGDKLTAFAENKT